MIEKGIALFVLLSCVAVLAEDKKWVWDKNSRSSKLRDAEDIKGSPRYEIFEPEGGDYGDYDRPLRPRPNQGPQGFPGAGGIGNRPNFGRPPFGGDFRPQRPLGPAGLGAGLGGPGYYPDQNIDPGFNGLGPGLGHGQGGRPFKRFDTCSCTERFNCQSPGLSYGQCDIGKSYCCYNKNGDVDIGPSPSRPIQSPANGVLVGPTNGGDIGYGHHGGRPDYDRPLHRPGYGSRPGYGGRPQGVLVGPGGPTGIIGRPGGVRPLHQANSGVLVGPGGPYDRPYGGYNRPPGGIGFFGRSADTPGKEDRDDAKGKDKRDV